jgi:preprotein translocase subunit SecG
MAMVTLEVDHDTDERGEGKGMRPNANKFGTRQTQRSTLVTALLFSFSQLSLAILLKAPQEKQKEKRDANQKRKKKPQRMSAWCV